MKQQHISHVFVDEVPAEVEPGILYVSMGCATAIHRCPCGCGQEVVTPFSPTDWSLIFDGDTVSLAPSVGNWSLPCRSHYFIERNTIKRAGNMSNTAVKLGRARDRRNKVAYFAGANPVSQVLAMPAEAPPTPNDSKPSGPDIEKRMDLWTTLIAWWKS